jgi:hypothetical protein
LFSSIIEEDNNLINIQHFKVVTLHSERPLCAVRITHSLSLKILQRVFQHDFISNQAFEEMAKNIQMIETWICFLIIEEDNLIIQHLKLQ